MTEDFLHHVWKYRLYAGTGLTTTEGEPVVVLEPGRHNTDAGPDFLDALIQIGDTTWAGHVEIHVKSSAWKSHGHGSDPAYNNVVLHVVHDNDTDIPGNAGALPTLVLRGRFESSLWKNYDELTASLQWISCSHRLKEVSPSLVYEWLDTVIIDRLHAKAARVRQLLEDNAQNWEEAFYQQLCYNYGLKVNAETFLALARSLPLTVLQKHRDSLQQVEALVYGQAGMLEGRMPDDYSRSLRQEYLFLKGKFRLEPMPYASWKFLRLRPVAFPTVRLAQLAGLLHRQPNLFSAVLETAHFEKLQNLFRGGVSGYWKTHYRFGQEAAAREKDAGDSFFHSLVINTIIPFLYAYGQWQDNEMLCRRALDFLRAMPPEDNKMVRAWKDSGIVPLQAAHTQSLLQLKSAWCEPKKCVHCSIGKTLIGKLP